MTDKVFRFEEKDHTYLLGDMRLDSVTEIVNDVYGIDHMASEFYMHRGSMVHKAVSLYLKGVLNESTVDERIKGKLEGAKKAIRELNLIPAVIETPMYDKIFRFAGTPDILTVDFILADWKSSHSPLTVEPQLGGYERLLTTNGYTVKRAMEIVLSDNGSYKMTEYDVRKCNRLFIAGLTVWNHKKGGKSEAAKR